MGLGHEPPRELVHQAYIEPVHRAARSAARANESFMVTSTMRLRVSCWRGGGLGLGHEPP